MRQPGRNNMNLWCVLKMPQNSSNLQGWFSTIRSTFEPKTLARSCINPHPEVPFCNHFSSKPFWPPIWSTWWLNLLAKYEECKSQIEKTAVEKRPLRQWPRQKAIPWILVIRIFWKTWVIMILKKGSTITLWPQFFHLALTRGICWPVGESITFFETALERFEMKWKSLTNYDTIISHDLG